VCADPATEMGAMVGESHLERVLDHIDLLRKVSI
jgi:acyl-CoA reductase-like NAD-dependent aldehyde dehydrogenase